MEFSYYDLLSINEIKSEVLVAVGDEDEKLLTPGFYRKIVRDALDELNFTTFFNTRWIDIPVPSDLKIPIPSGCFNLQDIFLYTNENCCDISCTNGTVRVFHKSNFLTKGKGHGYTARNKPLTVDPFVAFHGNNNVRFYNVNNGIIMLDDGCSIYPFIRLVFNGTAGDIDTLKIIPPFCRKGITMYAIERSFFYLKIRDPKYRQAWGDSRVGLQDAWTDCVYRIKRMSTKERSDLADYLSRMPY